jgi:HK97 family phage prohead protease
MELERRAVAEFRTDGGRVLFGLAAPYGQPARIDNFVERIAPGAFSRSLSERHDVMLLRDHDMHALLARTSNGSLSLEDASDGLRFRAELASFTLADDTLAQVRAGLLAGMSIGFHVRGETWNRTRDQRTLRDIELVEISAVGPAVAYGGTSISARHSDPSGSATVRRRLLDLL